MSKPGISPLAALAFGIFVSCAATALLLSIAGLMTLVIKYIG